MKSKLGSFDSRQRNWTRREVLVAGAAAPLGLAGCAPYDVSSVPAPHPTISSRLSPTISPSITPGLSPTSVPEKPVTLAFTGDVMFGRTVNSRMLATTPKDPYPFTYTADFLRGFDLTIGNLECVISRLGTPGHAWLNEVDHRHDVAKAHQSADFVITFVHWHPLHHLRYNIYRTLLTLPWAIIGPFIIYEYMS